MPAKISDNLSLDLIEEHIIFTQESLRAVPATEDLAPSLESWFQLLDHTNSAARQLRRKRMELFAKQRVSQQNLKDVCKSFSTELSYQYRMKGDQAYKTFFQGTPSRWLSRPIGQILDNVQAWLKTDEPALLAYRDELERTFKVAENAHLELKTLVFLRNEYTRQRKELGQLLTEWRDSLHHQLAAIARDLRLPRSWPDSFFLKSTKVAAAAV